MDEIRIPNSVTYSTVSLLELGMIAPLASRLLLRATLPGLALQTAALAVYAASAVDDWLARAGVRRIDFLQAYGADVKRLPAMPVEAREEEVRVLTERLNRIYTPERIPRRELARRVNISPSGISQIDEAASSNTTRSTKRATTSAGWPSTRRSSTFTP